MTSTAPAADPHAQLARAAGYLAHDPANPQLLAHACDLALEVGVPDQALQYAQAGLALRPADPYFAYRAACAHDALGHHAEADEAFAALLAVHPDPRLAYAWARSYRRRGRLADALAVLAPFAASPELDGPAAAELVYLLHMNERADEAAALGARLGPRLEGDAGFCAAAALANFDAGDLAAARRLAALAGTGPDAPLAARVTNATLALIDDDLERASAAYRAILAAHPEEGRSWSGLGMTSLVRQDLAAARAELAQARRCLPQHIGTMHLQGWCALFQNDLDGAEEAFGAALAQDRNFGESHGAMAVVHALRGARAAAEAAIERALRLDRESLGAVYARMVLSGQTRDPEQFRRIAMRVLARRPAPGGGDLAGAVQRRLAKR